MGNGSLKEKRRLALEMRAEEDFTRALIAAVVCNRLDAVAEVATWFQVKWIRQTMYYHLCRAMFKVVQDGEPATSYSIAKALLRSKRYHDVPLTKIDELVSNRHEFAHLRYYALQVYDAHRRQQALTEAAGSASALSDGEDLVPIIEELSTLGSRLGPAPEMRVFDNEQCIARIINELEHGVQSPVQYGVPVLDKRLHGPKNTNFVVIGARPSHGKSIFLGHFAIETALKDQNILFFSLEMSRQEMIERWASWLSQTPKPEPRSSFGRREFVGGLGQVDALIKAGRLQLFCGSKSIAQIEKECRAYCKRVPVSAICVDYLQKIKSGIKTDNRNQQVGECARRLKDLAMDFEVPVLAGSQLNRQGNEKPQMSHLRESGDIEQEANTIILMHPQNMSDPVVDLLLMVAKNRNGPTGEFVCTMHRPLCRLYDKDHRYDQPEQQEFV